MLLPGVGPEAAEKLWAAYLAARQSAGPSSADVAPPAAEAPPGPAVAPLLMAAAKAIPKKAVAAWANCATTVAQLETPPAAGTPAP